ncbi:MAG: DedA family protein [Nitrospirae bacterium]|nr:MAG: DedA family protein [Nitrospirota bacterium]
MDQIQAYLVEYGLWFVFVGCIFEGEVVLVVAGFLAHIGLFRFWEVYGIAVAGAITGDQFYYYLGRWRGEPIIRRVRAFSGRVNRAMALIDRWHGWLIPASRFMYGFRILLPLTFGMLRTPPGRFAALNVASAFPWAIIFISLGYFLGQFALDLIQRAHEHRGIAILVVMLVAGIVGALIALQASRSPRPERPE